MQPSEREELIRRARPGLVWWLWFSFNAMLVQAFASRWAARRSRWGQSRGWQREIAIWNVGLSVAMARALIEPEEPVTLTLAHSLRVLSVGLGLNHVAALRRGPRLVHVGGALGNALAVGALSRALRRPGGYRRAGPSAGPSASPSPYRG